MNHMIMTLRITMKTTVLVLRHCRCWKYQTGACGSCPSSTTTMKMGIERVLKEKFGDAVKDIRQVDDEEKRETTAEVSFLRILVE